MDKPDFAPPRYIVIEGPIRVGKSTLARILADQLHARSVTDCEDNPFLSDFYNERAGAAFSAQMYFLMERYRKFSGLGLDGAQGPFLATFSSKKTKSLPISISITRN